MDFRTKRAYKISNEATTSRNYGVFDNLVFVGNHSLSDSEIAKIEMNLESVAKSKAIFQQRVEDKTEKELEKSLEKQIDKIIEETLDKKIEELFK